MKIRPGVELLQDEPGLGALVERHSFYDFRIRIWLSRGDPVRWTDPLGTWPDGRTEDEGTTLFKSYQVDRRSMIAGLFYGVEGMRVGGTRRLRVAPHLAYGETGVPGVIPPNAVLTVEVKVLAARAAG